MISLAGYEVCYHVNIDMKYEEEEQFINEFFKLEHAYKVELGVSPGPFLKFKYEIDNIDTSFAYHSFKDLENLIKKN